MSLKFDVHRGDIALEVDESRRIYGSEFVVNFPIVMWYANLQFGQGNLFDHVSLPNSIEKVGDLGPGQGVDSLIDSVLSASCNLPKKFGGDNGVNTDLNHWGLDGFKGVDGKYNILILERSLDIWRDQNPDVSVADYAIPGVFAPSYLDMIADCYELEAFRPMVKHVYKRLKNEGD